MKKWNTGLRRIWLILFTVALMGSITDLTALFVSAQTITDASDYALVVDKETMEEGMDTDSNPSKSGNDSIQSGNIGVQTANGSMRIANGGALNSVETGKSAWNQWWIILAGVVIIVFDICVFLVQKKKKIEEYEEKKIGEVKYQKCIERIGKLY